MLLIVLGELRLTSSQSAPIPYSTTPPDHLPRNYGSYHQLYKLDGQLIALAVLDILPKCVSSVYFIYDKSWERFSMGKVRLYHNIWFWSLLTVILL